MQETHHATISPKIILLVSLLNKFINIICSVNLNYLYQIHLWWVSLKDLGVKYYNTHIPIKLMPWRPVQQGESCFGKKTKKKRGGRQRRIYLEELFNLHENVKESRMFVTTASLKLSPFGDFPKERVYLLFYKEKRTVGPLVRKLKWACQRIAHRSAASTRREQKEVYSKLHFLWI